MYDCVILCGGKGSRLRSLTGDTIPKSLVKVNGRELLLYALDLLSPEFISRIIFAVDHHSAQVESFVNSLDLGFPTSFCYQRLPGVLNAIVCAAEFSEQSTMLFLHSDEIKPGLRLDEALSFHRLRNATATVVGTLSGRLSRHWVVEYDKQDFKVRGFKIQSEEYRLDQQARDVILAGAFILEQSALQFFDPQMSADYLGVVIPLVKAGRLQVYVSQSEFLFNVGTPDEYDDALACLENVQSLDERDL